jgi:nucleosome binding factor SPN SPT16 subunit
MSFPVILVLRSFLSPRYDPDEIEEEQRERERRNQINKQFQQFVKRVQQEIWERDYG